MYRRLRVLAAAPLLLVPACGSSESDAVLRGPDTTVLLASPAAVMTSISETSVFAAEFRLAVESGAISLVGPVTILAPVNAAMDSTWPDDPTLAPEAVSCHVVVGSYRTEDFIRLGPTQLVRAYKEGVDAGISDGTVFFSRNGTTVRIVGANFEASNSVIHIVDGVLPC